MSYYIFRIGYQISDEIKKRKENEKPFWWEQLHPEAKNKTIEEIDKLVSTSSPPDKFKEMTKHEKYMLVSEGLYIIDLDKAKTTAEELEALKASQTASASSAFLDQGGKPGGVEPSPNGQNITYPVDTIEPSPLDIGLNEPHPKEGGNGTSDEPGGAGAGNPHVSEPVTASAGTEPVGAGAGQVKPATKAEIRKYAISIVRSTVNQVNSEAEKIADAPGFIPENELLAAVIEELQRAPKAKPSMPGELTPAT